MVAEISAAVSATQASLSDRGVYPEHVEGLISDPIRTRAIRFSKNVSFK